MTTNRFQPQLRARQFTVPSICSETSRALVPGDVVVYDSTDLDKVKLTNTAGNSLVAGVVVGDVDSTFGEGESVFVCVYGEATIRVTGTVASGVNLIASSTYGYAQDGSASTSGGFIGRAIEAKVSGGTGTIQAIINVYQIPVDVGVANMQVSYEASELLTPLNHIAAASASSLKFGDDSNNTMIEVNDNGTLNLSTYNATGTSGDITISSATNINLEVGTGDLIYFGSGKTTVFDGDSESIGVKTDSPGSSLHIGDGTFTGSAFFSGTDGIIICSSENTSRLFIESVAQADIVMVDKDSSANSKTIQIVNNSDRTSFNTYTDAGSSKTGNPALAIFHDDNSLALGTSTNDASALLNLTSTTMGFLPPRMTGAQRDAIGTPTQGLTIYNTDDSAMNIYDGSWSELSVVGHIHAASDITSGTLAVANGGTNKASWTANGILYASGTTTLTNSSSLTWDGSTVLVTGAAVNVTNSGGNATLYLNGPSGYYKENYFQTGGVVRWRLGVDNDAESGSNVGSDFYLNRFSDAGAYLGTAIWIVRASGCFGINIVPDSSAILHLSSTSKGFLPPKLTTVQRTAVSSPAVGLVIFNTTNDRLEVYAANGGSNRWEDMAGNAA